MSITHSVKSSSIPFPYKPSHLAFPEQWMRRAGCQMIGRSLGCAYLRDEGNVFLVAVFSPLSWQVQQILIHLNPIQEATRAICFFCFPWEPWFSWKHSVPSCVCWLAHRIIAFVTVATSRISSSCASHLCHVWAHEPLGVQLGWCLDERLRKPEAPQKVM